MGYRNYMFAISKNKVKELQQLSYDELLNRYREYEDSDFIDFHTIPDRQLYGFGEINADVERRIHSKGTPLFTNEKIQEEFSHYKPYIVGKEGLLEAIQIYSERTVTYYKGLLLDDSEYEFFPKTAAEKQQKHIEGVIREWERNLAINLSEQSDIITNSWRIEYSLFELTRLFKTFDFENETILFYGY